MRQLKTPSKFTLAHALMVLVGLMTFVLVSAVLNDRRATQSVLVAGQGAPAGAPVSALALVAIDVPFNDPLTGQFVKAGGVAGTERIARDVAPGQPLLNSDLLAPEATVGTRTFAIPVDDVVIRGLQLRPQDRVDIIGQDRDNRVYFVVADVSVASLSALVDGSGFSAGAGKTFVTVEVSDTQALALSAALRQAEVDLVRSTGAEAVTTDLAGVNR